MPDMFQYERKSASSIPAGLALLDSGAAKGEADVSTEEVATATLSVGQAPKSELGINSSRSETGSSAVRDAGRASD